MDQHAAIGKTIAVNTAGIHAVVPFNLPDHGFHEADVVDILLLCRPTTLITRTPDAPVAISANLHNSETRQVRTRGIPTRSTGSPEDILTAEEMLIYSVIAGVQRRGDP